MSKILINTIIAILLISAFACEKIRQLPPEPRIEFRNFALKDSLEPELNNMTKVGLLEFYFEDGDGDLGLGEPGQAADTIDKNIHLKIYRKINGVYEEPEERYVLGDADYRIPLLERTGQNKTLMGTIELTIWYPFLHQHVNDTIMYDLVIEDRAGNLSNTVSTCEIYFDMVGPCIIPLFP